MAARFLIEMTSVRSDGRPDRILSAQLYIRSKATAIKFARILSTLNFSHVVSLFDMKKGEEDDWMFHNGKSTYEEDEEG